MSAHDRKVFTISAWAAFSMVMCPLLVIIIIALLCAQSCSTPSKLETVQRQHLAAEIGLVQEKRLPTTEVYELARPDTIVVHDDDGRAIY